MDASFNFKLAKKKGLSKLCLDRGLRTYSQICEYVKQLPYGRNSNKNDLSLVLSEQKGTCSTKHAFLAKIAQENTFENMSLFIGIYKMNNLNTSGIGNILQNHNLEYIPEAHNYLRCNDTILDFTSSKEFSFEEALIYEERILPEQISNYKVNLHQSFIKSWIVENTIPYSFEKIWNIREQCILNLSQ